MTGLRQRNRHIEISITDNGIGITSEELPHIFDRYIHGDYKETGKGGIGLGLAIIRKILELHKTTINVRAGLRKGVYFIFYYLWLEA